MSKKFVRSWALIYETKWKWVDRLSWKESSLPCPKLSTPLRNINIQCKALLQILFYTCSSQSWVQTHILTCTSQPDFPDHV